MFGEDASSSGRVNGRGGSPGTCWGSRESGTDWSRFHRESPLGWVGLRRSTNTQESSLAPHTQGHPPHGLSHRTSGPESEGNELKGRGPHQPQQDSAPLVALQACVGMGEQAPPELAGVWAAESTERCQGDPKFRPLQQEGMRPVGSVGRAQVTQPGAAWTPPAPG